MTRQDAIDRAGLAYDRVFDPLGIARQAIAVIASGDGQLGSSSPAWW